MKKKYKKQVRVAMAVALAATSVANSTGSIFAQKESEISGYDVVNNEKVKEESKEVENLENLVESSLESKEGIQNIGRAVGDVEIDNEDNFPDPVFREYIRNNFDKNRDGILSSNEINAVTSINVNNNYKDITSMKGIEYFPNLTTLRCGNTNITELNISQNPELVWLDCFGVRITELDVSNNSKLEIIQGWNILITSLDVMNNPVLRTLSIHQNNLAWLHVGNNNSNLNVSKDNGVFDLGNIDKTFNIVDKFPGIDPNRIINIEGAEIDKTTGIVSGYTQGTPIVYTYDCGIDKNGAVNLNVILNFTIVKGKSSITINDELSKVYDGTAIELTKDNCTITGSTGSVSFEWYTADGQPLTSAPTEVGSYKVKAILADDANYAGASIEQYFIISQADNQWTQELSIQNWVYNATVNTPSAVAQFGTAEYTYSITEDGVYTDVVPSNAGTYWVKAVVVGTNNYKELEAKLSFIIEKANSSITINDDLNKVYDGQAVVEPVDIVTTGSMGAITFEWYTADGQLLTSAPAEVGSYKLVVSVAEDMNYNGVTAEIVFNITEAQQDIPPVAGDTSVDTGTDVLPGNKVEGVQTGDSTKVGLWTMLIGLTTGIMLFFTKNKSEEEK